MNNSKLKKDHRRKAFSPYRMPDRRTFDQCDKNTADSLIFPFGTACFTDILST